MNRLHIGIFGRRNVGKSAVINALSGQPVAIVSATAGTTTDPVKKNIELAGLGAAVLIDTAGIDDDSGTLGARRIEKSRQVIAQIDAAVLVIAHNTVGTFEHDLIRRFEQAGVPFLVLHNKADEEKALPETAAQLHAAQPITLLDYCALQPAPPNDEVIRLLQSLLQKDTPPPALLEGLVQPHDTVLLVTPIDAGAPAGRLILPQVQTIRALLDSRCVAIVLRETEAAQFLSTTRIRPALVITDSQLFGTIDRLLPREVPLTGFSILLARQKGHFAAFLQGTPAIDRLRNGDRIAILESCTHHSTCDDIGRVKIPRWLREHTGKDLLFDTIPGLSPLPRKPADYALALQCGGCMITPQQLRHRLQPFIRDGIPVTNYGMAIAHLKGIYARAVEAVLVKN